MMKTPLLIVSILAAAVFIVQAQDLVTNEVRPCTNSTCNQTCVAIGWEGGSRDLGQCWCWKRKPVIGRFEKAQTQLDTSAVDKFFCDDYTCHKNCIRAGWDGGSCIFGCVCWNSTESNQQVQKPLSQLEAPTTDPDCSLASCSQYCISSGHRGGYCSKGKCYCTSNKDKISSWSLLNGIPNSFQDTNGNAVTSCTVKKTCLDACKKKGAVDGFCLKKLCWCHCTMTSVNATRNMRPLLELQSNVSGITFENECIPSDCRRQCDNVGKTDGAACFYGYCWCKESKKIQKQISP